MKFSSSTYDKFSIWKIDFQPYIRFQFFTKSFFKISRCHIFSFFSCKRRIINEKFHTKGWFVDFDRWKRFNISHSNRFSYENIRDSTNRNNISAFCLLLLDSWNSKSIKNMSDFSGSLITVVIIDNDLFSWFYRSFIHTSNSKSSQKIVISKIYDLHSKILFWKIWSFRNIFHNCFEKRSHIFLFISKISHRKSIFCTCIDYREICLFIRCSKQDKKIKKHINHFTWSSCRFIDFIDDNDRF